MRVLTPSPARGLDVRPIVMLNFNPVRFATGPSSEIPPPPPPRDRGFFPSFRTETLDGLITFTWSPGRRRTGRRRRYESKNTPALAYQLTGTVAGGRAGRTYCTHLIILLLLLLLLKFAPNFGAAVLKIVPRVCAPMSSAECARIPYYYCYFVYIFIVVVCFFFLADHRSKRIT